MTFKSELKDAVEPSQTKPILGREDEMIENAAGGYVFEVDVWNRLERFLIIGTEGGTYYATEKKTTLDNVVATQTLIKKDGMKVVNIVLDVSSKGRAPKNDQALFVLALVVALGDPLAKSYALSSLHKVARTGTHLFQFVDFLKSLRALSGRATKRAIAQWYIKRDLDRLQVQVTKYRQRGGWSHRDILRLVHPVAPTQEMNNLFQWVVDREKANLSDDGKPETLQGHYIRTFEALQQARDEDEAVSVLRSEHSFTHEMVPTEVKGAKVWKELMPRLPINALVRNLPTLTRLDLIKPMSEEEAGIVNKLKDPELLSAGRVHPINMLIALYTYQGGKSLRGSSTWNPVPAISEALEDGFYAAFHGLPEISKRVYIAVDVSSSMAWGNSYRRCGSGKIPFPDIPDFSPMVVSAALSLCLQRQCNKSIIRGFCHEMRDLGYTHHTSLREARDLISNVGFGGTDCALPMIDALHCGIEVDAFIVLTDDETWAGEIHPAQALQDYRNKTGINAKMVVAGMTSTNCTIADPEDPGMLDVVGFDAALPKTLEEFIR